MADWNKIHKMLWNSVHKHVKSLNFDVKQASEIVFMAKSTAICSLLIGQYINAEEAEDLVNNCLCALCVKNDNCCNGCELDNCTAGHSRFQRLINAESKEEMLELIEEIRDVV